VIKDGKTGFITNSLIEMVEAVPRVRIIDGKLCRKYVEQNFDAPRMANDYLMAYERVLQGSLVPVY
jgi:hypothetical protein